MTAEAHSVILVHSTSHAMRIEQALTDKGIVCEMIPIPRQLSSDCGVCIRIPRSDAEAARRLVGKTGIVIEAIVDL